MRYRATVRATFDVEFDDDETSVLVDQAHDEARNRVPEDTDLEVLGEPILVKGK